MTFKVLDKIMATQTFAKIIGLRKKLGTNLIAVDCPWIQSKVQLSLIQDPKTFAARNDGPYNIPTQQTPTRPIINASMGTTY